VTASPDPKRGPKIENDCITDAFLDQFAYDPVEPIVAIRADGDATTDQPMSAAERMARNTRVVELQQEFIQACELHPDEDWSADRYRPEAAQ
jgi:hypothetical protein